MGFPNKQNTIFSVKLLTLNLKSKQQLKMKNYSRNKAFKKNKKPTLQKIHRNKWEMVI